MSPDDQGVAMRQPAAVRRPSDQHVAAARGADSPAATGAGERRALQARERLALAIQYRDAFRRPEAEALCLEALRLQPEDAETLRLAAALAHDAGREVEALEFADQAIARQPGHAGTHHCRGAILRALGRPDEALAAYREAIALLPDEADAWHGMGGALQDLNRLPESLRAYQEAVRLRPGFAEALLSAGVVLIDLGRAKEGLAALQAAAVARPELPAVQDRLGCALGTAGRWDEAVEAHQRAIALHTGSAAAYCNLGSALSAVGRHHEAADALQAALTLEPQSPDAHNRMGLVLKTLGYLDQAVSAYRQALAGRPDFAEAHFNLGELLSELGRPIEALTSYRSSLAFRPDFAEAHARIGGVLMKLARPSEAVTAFRLALTLRPDSADTWYELGNAMRMERRTGEAIAAYSHAIDLQADHAAARYARGLVQLSVGNFAAGWEGYEWRWKVAELRLTSPNVEVPQWEGDDLDGRTLLVSAAGALPEEIFRFARYLPLLATRGGRVVFECPAALCRLLEVMPGIAQTVTAGESLPAIDLHIPLGSLPRLLPGEYSAPPVEAPYLPTRIWSTRVPLLPAGGGLRVGIAWKSREGRGAPAALTMAALAPLFRVPGVTWYSLEAGEEALQPGEITAAGLHDLAPLVKDVADLAALMGQLDLVVSVDAAVAELAGGLGIPLWVLLNTASGWQWGAEGERCLWYPTARLFRQNVPGGWATVVEQVAQALRRVLGE